MKGVKVDTHTGKQVDKERLKLNEGVEGSEWYVGIPFIPFTPFMEALWYLKM